LNRNESEIEIDFQELADGSIVEMIEHPEDATKTLLAVYSNESVRCTERIEDRGRILVPLPRADNDLRHVCLAAGVEAYGRIHDLISDVVTILGDCLDLDRDSLKLMGAFAISTWFPEKLTIAPYLALVGPPGSGKTAAMLILNSLLYRGLLTTDISPSAFYDIAHRIRPTTSLDETLTAGRPRELMHLLKASSTRGFAYLRKNRTSLAFGPKVFSWLELPDDQALNTRCIIIPMHRTSRTDLKSPNDPKVLDCTRKMRMRLLQFRFERLRNASEPMPPLNVQLAGRSLDLYRALALPFKEYEPFCEFLADRIAAQDRLQARPLSPAQLSTIWILFQTIHKAPDLPGVSMSLLAKAVSLELKERGEPSGLNERKLGSILTSLSMTSRTRTRLGYLLWFNRAEKLRIHAARRDYGVEGSHADSIAECPLCTPTGKPTLATPKARTRPPVKAQVKANDTRKGQDGKHRERRERRERRLRSSRFSAGLGSD
jgi:hypothetical protein